MLPTGTVDSYQEPRPASVPCYRRCILPSAAAGPSQVSAGDRRGDQRGQIVQALLGVLDGDAGGRVSCPSRADHVSHEPPDGEIAS
jgi:hypothetical protein